MTLLSVGFIRPYCRCARRTDAAGRRRDRFVRRRPAPARHRAHAVTTFTAETRPGSPVPRPLGTVLCGVVSTSAHLSLSDAEFGSSAADNTRSRTAGSPRGGRADDVPGMRMLAAREQPVRATPRGTETGGDRLHLCIVGDLGMPGKAGPRVGDGAMHRSSTPPSPAQAVRVFGPGDSDLIALTSGEGAADPDAGDLALSPASPSRRAGRQRHACGRPSCSASCGSTPTPRRVRRLSSTPAVGRRLRWTPTPRTRRPWTR
jgi:hypothetical protein